MIVGINYADEKFAKAQKLNTWSMYHKGKVDKVIEYNPESVDLEFKKENEDILKRPRGGGYWLWKPYIIKKTLAEMNYGDYLFYCDSGAVILKPIQYLIDAMNAEGQEIMTFCLEHKEKFYTKRDAFILMECDKTEYTDTPQRLATYILIRKSEDTINFVDEFLKYAQDPRIITDDENVMGMVNYKGFKDHRHDQTIWSLLTKKCGIVVFRDPSQFGREKELFDIEVNERSTYPVVVDSTRNGSLDNWIKYKIFRMRNPWEKGGKSSK